MIYVALDADRVQDFVFASIRLRGIRNGSRQVEAADQAASALLAEGERIRALGGVVIAAFEDGERYERFVTAARSEYRVRGIGVTVASITLEAEPADFYGGVIAPLLREIRRQKDSPAAGHAGEPGSILCLPCEVSGMGPAEAIASGPDRWAVRPAERGKWELKDENPLATRLFDDWNAEVRLPTTAEGVVAWSADTGDARGMQRTRSPEDRLLGLVFADVNGLGALLPELARDRTGFAAFAPALQDALRGALTRAMQEVLEQPFLDRSRGDPDLALPFRLLFLGGDDMALLVAARYALPLVGRLTREFEERSVAFLTPFKAAGASVPECLSLAAGVVLAPHKTPFLALKRLAQELEGNAKAMGRAWSGLAGEPAPSMVDFHVWVNDATGTLDDVRARGRAVDTAVEGAALTGGPYLTGRTRGAGESFLPLDDLLAAAEACRALPAGKTNELRVLLQGDGAAQRYREWWDHVARDLTHRSAWTAACAQLGVPATRETPPFRTTAPCNTPVLDCLQVARLLEAWSRS